jgi:3-keto-disaccharide hydrolase
MKNFIYLVNLLIVFVIGCTTSPKETNYQNDEMTAVDDSWIWLFDGSSTKGWRGFNMDKLPAGWIIEDSTLKSLGKGGDIGGDIIYGERTFEDFELYLEWKVSTAGNSGIFYHVQEGKKYHAPYENAPEYQLLDDLGYPDPLEDWQKLASDYAMYPTPAEKPIKPAGEWNTSRIIFTKDQVQYFLNGEKMVEFVPWSDDWNRRRKNGKWAAYEDYGRSKSGFIGLQDHGSFIWFKNIKIRDL